MTEEEWDKIVGQFRLEIGGVLEPLRKYGQDTYVATVKEEIVSLAIQLSHKLYGIDEMPYQVNHNKLHY